MRAKLVMLTVALAMAIASGLATAASGFPPFLRSWGAAGAAPGSFMSPDQLAVDARGDVYVADRQNDRVQKFDFRGHLLAVLGGTGVAPGKLRGPRGVAVDGLGDLYVADSGNNRIQKFDPRGRVLAVWGRNAGDGSAGIAPGQFNDPRGIATDSVGELYVADHGNNRVQKLSPFGRVLEVLGRNHGDGSAGTGDGEFNKPRDLTVDAKRDLYVADKDNNRIQKFNPSGKFLTRWGRNGGDGSAGTGRGEFHIPYSVAAAPGVLYVADTGNNRLQEFTSGGAFIAALGKNGGDGTAGAGSGEFSTPYGIAVDCRGNLYVSDEGNDRIQVFGEPAAPPPICGPVLRLGQLRAASSRITLPVSCNAPCTMNLRARFQQGNRIRRTRRVASLGFDGLRQSLRIGLPPSVRRELHRGTPITIVVSVEPTGFGGSAPTQSRRATLRPR